MPGDDESVSDEAIWETLPVSSTELANLPVQFLWGSLLNYILTILRDSGLKDEDSLQISDPLGLI